MPKGHSVPIITSDNRSLRPWRQQIAATAIHHMNGTKCVERHIPVSVDLLFYFARPKSLSVKKRPAMTTKPDLDKLIRAVLDSISGIIIHDDSQVSTLTAYKMYDEPERVIIEVRS